MNALSLFFLAQALAGGMSEIPRGHHSPSSRPLHAHASPSPSATPQVRITIVNATCVPSVSLSVAGTNLPAAYPVFPQGEWTANAAVTNTEIHYAARFPDGPLIAEKTFRFPSRSTQFLVLTGDLSRKGPSEKLPPVMPVAAEPPQPWAPNFQFHVYPVELATKDPCHYRIINAMPERTLTLRTPSRNGKPSRLLGLIAPGNSLLLTGQPANVEWVAEIEGESLPLVIMQEGAVGNCLVPFFLRNGKPDFVRVFETP